MTDLKTPYKLVTDSYAPLANPTFTGTVATGAVTATSLNGCAVPTTNLSVGLCSQRATGTTVSGTNQINFDVPDTAIPIWASMFVPANAGTKWAAYLPAQIGGFWTSHTGTPSAGMRRIEVYIGNYPSPGDAYQAWLWYSTPATGLSA